MRMWLCFTVAVVLSGCSAEPAAPPAAASKTSRKAARAETPPPQKPKPVVAVSPDAYPDEKQAVTALVAALQSNGDSDDEKSERKDAEKALGWLRLKKETAVPALAEMLKQPDSTLETQIATCWALGRMGPAATPALLANVDHPTRQVRMKVLESLSHIKPADVKVVAKLIELIDSDDQPTRQAAVQGLARIGPSAKAAVAGLLEILNNTSESEALRSDAKAALKKVDPRRGLMGVAEKAKGKE